MSFFNTQPFLRIALLISIIIALAGFLTDFHNTQKYGGIDLRDRVVGARVASELGNDPYFFKWTDNQSDRYLDPLDNKAVPIYNRLTVTPAVLLFHSFFSDLSYKTQRYLWFLIQWICLLGSICLLSKILSNDQQNRILIWILGLLGISGSMFWRLHVERGQIYIVYVFLFCLAFYLYNKYQNKIASGLILGCLISLRPTFVFAIIPFLIYKKIKFTSLITIGIIVSVLVSSLLSSSPLWKSYYKSVQLQTSFSMDETINYEPVGGNTAEGLNLRDFLSVPGEDSSLFRIFRGIFNQWFSSTTFFILLSVFLAAISAFLIKFKIPKISVPQLFFLAVALSLFSEFFIAAPRWPYANVIWLIPLAIMVTESKKLTVTPFVFCIYTLTALCLITNLGFFLIPHFTFVGDAGIPCAILLFIIAMLTQKRNST